MRICYCLYRSYILFVLNFASKLNRMLLIVIETILFSTHFSQNSVEKKLKDSIRSIHIISVSFLFPQRAYSQNLYSDSNERYRETFPSNYWIFFSRILNKQQVFIDGNITLLHYTPNFSLWPMKFWVHSIQRSVNSLWLF